jgi:SAM-dependent methyltransferase
MNRLNLTLLNRLPFTATRVLDVGCGNGGLAFAYRRRNPNAFYAAVEIDPALAAQAKKFCSQVYQARLEDDVQLRDLQTKGPFDLLILRTAAASIDQLSTRLALLRPILSPSATCVLEASDLTGYALQVGALPRDASPADPASLQRMLQWLNGQLRAAGWRVMDAQAFRAGHNPIQHGAPPEGGLTQDWVLRLTPVTQPSTDVLHVAALGLKRVAGVTEARVDYPLSALRAEPATRVIWDAGRLAIPQDMVPGILMLHRYPLPNDDVLTTAIERYIEKGWLVVLDFDDDPRFWPDNVKNNFVGFRRVHAVSVSTPALAALIGEWNPQVKLLPNAVFEVPWLDKPPAMPVTERPLRIFYGALNREEDMQEIAASLLSALKRHAGKLELEVIHDKRFFDSLPDGIQARFHSILPVNDYHRILMSCDVALLPLRDTAFNRCKSDLKFIECCAHGVVPVCSSVVYANQAAHRAIGVFPEGPRSWGEAIEDLLNDPDDIIRRRDAGRTYIFSQRMHAQSVRDREVWFRSLLGQRTQLEDARRERMNAFALQS